MVLCAYSNLPLFPYYSAGDIVNMKILSYPDGSTKETQHQKSESKKSLQQQQVDQSSFQQQQQLQVHQQYSDQQHQHQQQQQQQQKHQQQSDQSKGFRQTQQFVPQGAGGEVVQAIASNTDMQQTRRKPRTSVGETLAHGSHQHMGYRYTQLHF